MRSRTRSSAPSAFRSGAVVGRAAVLPDDRAVNRLARLAIPDHDGLALVGDPERGDTAPVDVTERFLNDRERVLPDLFRVVLDPAPCRIMLRQLALSDRNGGGATSNKMARVEVVP